MYTSDLREHFHRSIREMETFVPGDWDDLSNVLLQAGNHEFGDSAPSSEDHPPSPGNVAFITFEYGIDGVSIEISKYARALEDNYGRDDAFSIHLIGEAFYPAASSLFAERWHRFIIKGINGWNKWDGGKWFRALYRQKMPPSSRESARLAKEMYKQTISITNRLGTYLIAHNVALLIPVNIASNPGNFSFTLSVALVSEILGMGVLNINHDFYWEEGRTLSERGEDEAPGIRDHFFMNSENRSFFALFQSLYPYNGKRWLQANINKLQSRKLTDQFHFYQEKVFQISTFVGNSFFKKYDQSSINLARLRMGRILSDGEDVLRPLPISDHLDDTDQWMRDQSPRVIGAGPGLSLDLRSDDLIILLQPTRIIQRKRIGRNLELIGALIHRSALGRVFNQHASRKLLLHITGPVPKEHKADLNQILQSYDGMLRSLPPEIAERLFLSFSVGHQEHPSFAKNKLDPLTVDEIFRMADAVVFPSESEGRGLPIIEAGAVGIPIICSRYRPEKVFAEVVGEHLPQEQQIHYTLFPEGEFSQQFLDEVAELLLHPQTNRSKIAQNKKAVQARYSRDSMRKDMANLLDKLID